VIVQFKSTKPPSSNGQNGNGQNGNGQNQNGNFQGEYDNNVNQIGQQGQVKTKLPQINAVHMKLTLAAIQALEANPSVAYVTPNRPLKGHADITTQSVNAILHGRWAGWNRSRSRGGR